MDRIDHRAGVSAGQTKTASDKEPISVVQQAVYLDASVERLWQSLSALRDELEPVLRTAEPLQDGLVRPSVEAPLGEELARLSDRVDLAAEFINNLRSRLFS